MTQAEPVVIQFREVSKSVTSPDGNLPIISNFTAAVPAGAIVTLVGPSGSGKSTLLSLCNLLLTPDFGEIYIRGKEIREWPVTALRREAGLVFQASPMLPGTVHNNIMTINRLHGTPVNPESLLEKVGLSGELLHRNVQDLSGGQRQKLALARTIASKPSILLLDEVTSALDPASVHDMEELLLTMNREDGTTIIWVTHNMEQAERVGDFTWFLKNGRLLHSSDTKSFFSSPQQEIKSFLEGASS